MDKRWAGALRFIGIGWYIAIAILIGTLGGRWIGQQVGGSSSELAFTLVGLFLGIVVAFFGMYHMIKVFISDERKIGGEDK